MRYVTGVGGANMDLHGRSNAPIIMRDSNPGHLYTSLGGVTRNILDNLSRLGIATKLCSAVGTDTFGDAILAGCAKLGIDMQHVEVCEGQRSSCYLSIMDDEGDMLVAMSDMSVIKSRGAEFILQRLPIINQSEMCVCDTDLCPEALEALVCNAAIPVFIDPVSTSYARTMVDLVGKFDTIKPNLMEMEILAGGSIRDEADLSAACDTVLAKGAKHLFVSRGAEGIYYKGTLGCVSKKSRPVASIANATGAGDATMASLIYSRLSGFSIEKTVSFALAAGIAAISSPDTINPDMSPALIRQYEKEYVL